MIIVATVSSSRRLRSTENKPGSRNKSSSTGSIEISRAVGEIVGDWLGKRLGTFEGEVDGEFVGDVVGDIDGAKDGAAEGLEVGAAVMQSSSIPNGSYSLLKQQTVLRSSSRVTSILNSVALRNTSAAAHAILVMLLSQRGLSSEQKSLQALSPN